MSSEYFIISVILLIATGAGAIRFTLGELEGVLQAWRRFIILWKRRQPPK